MKPNRKNYKSIPIFSNPIVERISHIHPATPFLVWSPVIVFTLLASWKTFQEQNLGIGFYLFLVASGVFVWTFVEYVLHRWLFHLRERGPITKRMQFVMHGFHHEDASDPTRLVMTPVVSIILAGLFYILFQVLLGSPACQPFFGGFILGYLAYDYVHYYVHFFTPTTRLGKYLKSHHMKHHYFGSEIRWGVSSPLWDVIFGTLEVRKELVRKNLSPTRAEEAKL